MPRNSLVPPVPAFPHRTSATLRLPPTSHSLLLPSGPTRPNLLRHYRASSGSRFRDDLPSPRYKQKVCSSSGVRRRVTSKHIANGKKILYDLLQCLGAYGYYRELWRLGVYWRSIVCCDEGSTNWLIIIRMIILWLMLLLKAELICLLPRSLLDTGFVSGDTYQDKNHGKKLVSRQYRYSWCGQCKAPSYLNCLVFPQDFLAAL